MRSLKFLVTVSLVSILNLAGLVVIAAMLRLSAGAGPVATMNGDVNGDGSLNLGDVVYLLNYIFEGGAPPVAIAGPLIPSQSAMPHPANLVCITSYDLAPPEGILTVEPGDTVVLYEVPMDKWFVLQGICGVDASSQFELVQNLGGAVSRRIGRLAFARLAANRSVQFTPGAGLRFEPGSNMELRHTAFPGSPEIFSGVLTGYLVDAP